MWLNKRKWMNRGTQYSQEITDLVALSMVAIGAVRREKICEMQLK